MQQVRLWEITPDQQLVEIKSNPIPLEERLEDWLESDISVLDENLLVIGRQVRTDSGEQIDLLCLYSAGDTVVVEIKKGRTPREVTAQALDYASWVKNLSFERLSQIADDNFKAKDSLAARFQEKFGEELPTDLNQTHRSVVVAERMDESTERIVKYLSDLNVPINVATVKHFKDSNGREMLAQVYLIEPEVAEEKARAASKNKGVTLASLQAEADGNGIGEMFRQMREGTRGILLARPYFHRIWYGVRLANRGQRAVLIVWADPPEEGPGMSFKVHVTRFSEFRGVSKEQLWEWLPEGAVDANVRGWSGSSDEERENSQGFGGSFKSLEEVEKFLTGLRTLSQG